MGSVVDGISKAVSSVGKSMGGPVGDLLSSAGDFLQSPIGKMAAQVGLAALTGGSSLMASDALGSLFAGGASGDLFGSLASSFLGDAASGTSAGGLGALMQFAQGQDSGGLLDMLKGLGDAQAKQPQSDDGSQAGQQANLQSLIAWQQAQSINSSVA